jgi:hypothetical protein
MLDKYNHGNVLIDIVMLSAIMRLGVACEFATRV